MRCIRHTWRNTGPLERWQSTDCQRCGARKMGGAWADYILAAITGALIGTAVAVAVFVLPT